MQHFLLNKQKLTSLKDGLNDLKIVLDSELYMNGGEIVGTHMPTKHQVMISARVEILSPDRRESNETIDMRQKLELLNVIIEKEVALFFYSMLFFVW